MNIIEAIQQEAQIHQWPFPKIFEALKAAGIMSYTITLTDHYHAIFKGSFGIIEQNGLENYKSLSASKAFSSIAVREAIVNHMAGKTDYERFLDDIAKAGVSHYTVNMQTREIRYFNPDETQYHQEIVP